MKLRMTKYLSAAVLFSGFMLGQQSPSAGPFNIATAHPTETTTASNGPVPPPSPPLSAAPAKHKLGPLEISINWRTRAEGWNWFEGNTGNSDYGLWNSLLRVGIGQTRESFDWFVEGEQPSILGMPNDAVVAAPQGQLGLGGSYYAANNNHTNEANGFVKQAFVNFKHLGPAALKLGRFEYFDGAEVKPADAMLATVIQTRITNRLISNFGFSAVQRAFDGAQLSLNSKQNNLTFFGARPTEGVFQVKGMDELDVDIYAGTYTRSISTKQNAGELRVFAMGYIDHRTLRPQNRQSPSARCGRPTTARSRSRRMEWTMPTSTMPKGPGKFDFLLWGVVQNGSWGNLDSTCRGIRWRGWLATSSHRAETVDQCRLLLRQRRWRSE